MYYLLTNGETYGDYCELIIYHRRKFTPEAFKELVQQANTEIPRQEQYQVGHNHDILDIAHYLIANHDFKPVTPRACVAVPWNSRIRIRIG